MFEFFRDYLAPSGSIHCVAITPDAPVEDLNKVTGRYFGVDAQAAADWCIAQNASGRNVYWTVNITTPGLNRKPAKSDIVGIRVAHVDIDPPRGADSWDKQAALTALITRGAPSLVIDSGNGLQALWWLTEGTTVEQIEQINRGISTAFAADHCWNVDRLFRVPGSTNWPDARKRSLGRVPVMASVIVPYTGRAYTPTTLAASFPAGQVVAVLESLPDGPCEGYTGPADDAELLKLMFASRGSMSAMFGDKATVQDLWNADPVTLAKFFPSDSGDDFNHSQADAALLAHLAFYTGKDSSRIDRMFRKSGLFRDKWDRDSYRVISVGKAVSGCTNFYNVPPRAPAGLPGVTVTAPLEGEVLPPGELMMLHEQQEHFKGCTYIASLHQVLVPSGDTLKPESFNAMYGGHVFLVANDTDGGGATEKKAFTAFTENRALRFPKAHSTMFKPQLPFGEIVNSQVNVYIPDPSVESREGDVTPMIRHIAKLLPDARDQEILWTYLAAVVQHPGEKFQWAPFIQGVQGNGKSIISSFMKRAVGPRYCHEPFAEDLTNKFNDWLDSRILIVVEELTLEGRYEVAENLKTWITGEIVEMQPKGGKKTMRENLSNWLILSNWQSALPIDERERRYAALFTAQQTAADIARDFEHGYFPALWDWLRADGYAYLTHHLRTRPLHPEFNPVGRGPARARAPQTTSTVKATSVSRGRYEQEIIEAMNEGIQGFRAPWISSIALRQLEERCKIRALSPIKRKAALESLGYVDFRRSNVIIMAEGGRPSLYIQKESLVPGLTENDYIISQGYTG